jgi:AcrR family transcriptional regulator
MQRVGPAKFTLQLVATEAGISAPTLIQRFGSKRALLRRMGAGTSGMGVAIVASLRERHPSPLRVAREFLLCFAEMARTPKEMAHHLAWLQLDLTDPVMHRHFLRLSRENADLVAALLEEAVRARELRPLDAPAMGRLLNGLVSGSLLSWAAYREGTARAWLERDVDLVLAPYRTGRTADR